MTYSAAKNPIFSDHTALMGMKLNSAIHRIDASSAMIRLTALWALSEAGLGGLLHLLRTPFTGLLVGSVAVVLIGLMAYVSDNPLKTIPKALVLVLIVKMTISPHSPLPAYLAVSFQGLFGALVFSLIPSFRISCLLLGFFALMESALQKILTLTIIFGKSIWESLDLFVDYVLSKMAWIDTGESVNGSLWIVVYYVSMYAIFGLIVGYFASVIPQKVNELLPKLEQERLHVNPHYQAAGRSRKGPWWKSNKFKFLTAILIVIILVFWFVPGAERYLNPLWVVGRVVLVLALWYLLVAPFLLKLFQRFLDKKAGEYNREVRKALSLVPVFRQLVFSVWEATSAYSGFTRGKEFVIRMIGYALIYQPDDE